MFACLIPLVALCIRCQSGTVSGGEAIPAAEQGEEYLPLLEGKRVALVVNHTATAGGKHLLDFLLENGIRVVAIFAPEHGFRGEAADGEIIGHGKDEKSGVPVFSLYGENRKPSQEQLTGTDLVVFDIQDVGCRFYTYLSTLRLVMEACAEAELPLVVLDRPNPNGDYVAGPVLKPEFSSFIGMVPVPVVHGCTLGEMAGMINGEGWHEGPGPCALHVVKIKNYTHATRYEPPLRPSPNLPCYLSIRLYPSLCLFEATRLSIGRGTEFPFQVIGGPDSLLGDFRFTPREIPGVSENPPHKDINCYGVDLRGLDSVPRFTLRYLIDFYRKFNDEKDFLLSERGFNIRAGDDLVLRGIRQGKSEEELVAEWLPGLEKYRETRKKYLLYPDSE